MRGIKEENLQGLRKRIASLFLQYIKSPQFNPAIANLLKVSIKFFHLTFKLGLVFKFGYKVPQDVNDAKLENYYCDQCQRYLPSTEFQISSSHSKVGKCKSCKNLENIAVKRVDFTKFK